MTSLVVSSRHIDIKTWPPFILLSYCYHKLDVESLFIQYTYPSIFNNSSHCFYVPYCTYNGHLCPETSKRYDGSISSTSALHSKEKVPFRSKKDRFRHIYRQENPDSCKALPLPFSAFDEHRHLQVIRR